MQAIGFFIKKIPLETVSNPYFRKMLELVYCDKNFYRIRKLRLCDTVTRISFLKLFNTLPADGARDSENIIEFLSFNINKHTPEYTFFVL